MHDCTICRYFNKYGKHKIVQYKPNHVFAITNPARLEDLWFLLKKVRKDSRAESLFDTSFNPSSVPFNLRDAKPINEQSIKLSYFFLSTSNRVSITAHVDFTTFGRQPEYNDFVMVHIPFNPPQDWTSYLSKAPKLHIQIYGKDIPFLQLEVKAKNKAIKVIDEKIKLLDLDGTAPKKPDLYVDLKIHEPLSDYAFVDEICFTVFYQFMSGNKFGEFYVDLCEILILDDRIQQDKEMSALA